MLTPRDSARQRCLSHELIIEPEAADSSTSRDVYGNISSYFHVTERHSTLMHHQHSRWSKWIRRPRELYGGGSARRRRGRSPAPSAPTARWPPSSPWTCSRRRSPTSYVLTPHRVSSPGRPLIEVLRDLNVADLRRLHLQIRVDDGVHQVGEVLAAREGVCQDFARLAIACLRANGLAASYVSGYLATDPPPGKERMVGIDATHAWASVWTPQNQWLGLDPTNDQMADERYITVGYGRDYADVPPLRGIIYTDSEAA